MLNKLTEQEFNAVKTFAEGLIGCYENASKKYTDGLSQAILGYVLTILRIHLDLAEIDYKRWKLEVDK